MADINLPDDSSLLDGFFLPSKNAIISSTLRFFVSGTFLIMTITANATITVNTRNTYELSNLAKYGNVNVKTKLATQFVNIQMAKAALRASCLKHSATYMKGIGPIKNNNIHKYKMLN